MSVAPFDWRAPNFAPTWAARAERLARLRANPSALPALHEFYRENPIPFIADWGTTVDPRLIERGLPALMPFVPWPRQIEWLEWVLERWRGGEPGITLKSRDSGVSWLSVALSCTLALFNPNMAIGFGSRKLEYVDQLGAPKSLFEKARLFMSALPAEFTGGWNRDKHAPHCRIFFPSTGSVINGESGDQCGRGDRTAIYWLDESAYLERAESIYAALSATTNCLLEISTPRGLGNPFSERWHSGKIPGFEFKWDQDPRKDAAWLERMRQTLDATTLAQEVLCDFQASADNVICPAQWVAASVGAAAMLGITPRGAKVASFDVADQGKDLCCFAARRGVEVQRLATWSGAGSDIIKSTKRVFDLCDEFGAREMRYDSEGMGSGVRAACGILNQGRTAPIADQPFAASGSVVDPDGESMAPGRTHADLFLNAKSQAMWALRLRFQHTFRCVIEAAPVVDPELIISLDPGLPELDELLRELSQPQYQITPSGKIQVDKHAGGRSPNRCDALAQLYAPQPGETSFFSALLQGESKTAEAAPAGITLPEVVGCVVASIGAGVPPFESDIGVVYWAYCGWLDSPLTVADWDVCQLDGDSFATLVPRVVARIREIAKEFHADHNNVAVLIDPAGVGPELYIDACGRGLEGCVLLDENIAALDLSARAVAASGHVLRGLAKASVLATEKTATLRAATKNWLTPIMHFSARAPEAGGPLLVPMIDMVCDTYMDKRELERKAKRRA
jgi:hypothetical protein